MQCSADRRPKPWMLAAQTSCDGIFKIFGNSELEALDSLEAAFKDESGFDQASPVAAE